VDAGQNSLHPFVRLSREDWARLPADASFTLSEDDVREIGVYLSQDEARDVYLPLSRLLYLHVDATQSLYRVARAFLAEEEKEVPYVVGIAGSVAAGKSTVARVLRALISRWPGRPDVGLVSTDGFLYPNRILRARGLMERKGFPESYDLPLLLKFLADIKSGRDGVSAPIHSHLTYDITGSSSPTTATSLSTSTPRSGTSKNGIWSASCACGKRRSGIAPPTSTVSRSSLSRTPET
jgi:type I pantothenate kinase